MLKQYDLVEGLEAEAADALRTLLAAVPAIRDLDVTIEPSERDPRPDVVARFSVGGYPRVILVEVKSNGQPRHVRAAVHRLGQRVGAAPQGAAAVLIAPYLSEEARALCRDSGVGFLDLEGNCRIAFDSVFIERTTPTRPAVVRRDLKSLFKPKAARVLRLLLRDPHRAWKVNDLAEATVVSAGHVSHVRRALIDREWAIADQGGLRLTRPNAMLDHWREHYEPPVGANDAYYTPLHGAAFEEAARRALGVGAGPKAVLASYSAARWIAPYARTPVHFLYANSAGVLRQRAELQLQPAARGENVIIRRLDDEGPFLDAIEPAPGVFTTGVVQTYLDLTTSGERGQEAAEHLRREAYRFYI
jgi:hypothetical protein